MNENTHQHDTHTPDDIRELAGRLERLGERERRAGEDTSERVAMRTLAMLHGEVAGQIEPSRHGRLRAAWLWIAAPAVAAAAVLVAVMMVMPRQTTTPGSGTVAGTDRVDVLAAGLESDIDTFFAMDDLWEDDGFDTGIAALSLDAAELASQPTTDTDALTSLGSDL